MVLINGIKYACERCIRGHRVTTCTHTDQPLTMIKPKGRPASQCHHCREQRKLKNSHVSCSCGKKGKSPGMHLGSCLCHKNAHCTCSNNSNKKNDMKKRLQKGIHDVNVGIMGHSTNISNESDKIFSGNICHSNSNNLVNSSNSMVNSNSSMIENNNEMSNNRNMISTNSSVISTNGSMINNNGNITSNSDGNSNRQQFRSSDKYVIDDIILPFETSNDLFDIFSSSSNKSSSNLNNINESNSNSVSSDTSYNNTVVSEEHNKSNTTTELVDNMFPLFPLVGSCSFDDSKSQPLLSLPIPETISSASNTNGILNANNIPNGITNQPKLNENPYPASYYQPIRPKRPESDLSMISNSSTATSVSKTFDNSLNFKNLPSKSNSSPFLSSIPFTSFDMNQIDDSLTDLKAKNKFVNTQCVVNGLKNLQQQKHQEHQHQQLHDFNDYDHFVNSFDGKSIIQQENCKGETHILNSSILQQQSFNGYGHYVNPLGEKSILEQENSRGETDTPISTVSQQHNHVLESVIDINVPLLNDLISPNYDLKNDNQSDF